MSKPGVSAVNITKISAGLSKEVPDLLAVEEPLEIRVGYGPERDRIQKNIAVTMRTPGHDMELAAGFLFTEGLITDMEQVYVIRYCTDAGRQEELENIVRVELKAGIEPDLKSVERNFYTTSSCGVCGKTSIDAVHTSSCFTLPPIKPLFSHDLIHKLPAILLEKQRVFSHTGGLHAAALFNVEGELLFLREDVGRHNALDKLIGVALSSKMIPLSECLVLVSGRASFELVQKAIMAGIPMLAAVGAPSSLAVDLAKESGMTLMGFVRENRFNIYCGEGRLELNGEKTV